MGTRLFVIPEGGHFAEGPVLPLKPHQPQVLPLDALALLDDRPVKALDEFRAGRVCEKPRTCSITSLLPLRLDEVLLQPLQPKACSIRLPRSFTIS